MSILRLMRGLREVPGWIWNELRTGDWFLMFAIVVFVLGLCGLTALMAEFDIWRITGRWNW